MEDRLICPCCGEYHFEEEDFYEVCEVCGWEDDGLQRDEPDYEGGANTISLNQAREVWRQTHDIKASDIANRRAYQGLPVFDSNGKVILEDPEKKLEKDG